MATEPQTTSHEQRATSNEQRIMQNKPNSTKARMKLNFYSTKDYENKPRLRTPGKQTQSNPISKGAPMLLRLTTNGRRESNIKIDIPANGWFNAYTMNSKSDESRATRYGNISIIGDGGMATVLAMLLCEKREASHEPRATSHEIRMWGYDRQQLEQIQQGRENKKFLPGYKLPEALVFEPEDGRIMSGADLIVSAVPCQFMRRIWNRLKDYVPAGVPIVTVAKGIENKTLLRPTQILADVLGEKLKTVVLSGPTIADELARKLPAIACAACTDEGLAKQVQYTFCVPWFRVYTNTDVVGVELAAACKNIIAIAAGIIDGMGAGDNAKAALLSRGLAEITRLGIAGGARPQTFAGLTGLGDLVTTCVSPKGRNRSFGERIGKGQSVEAGLRATESVIEGAATCKSVVALAARYNVEMPITQAVYEVLFEGKSVQTAITDLMRRRLKAE